MDDIEISDRKKASRLKSNANLKPIKKGEIRNPYPRQKGTGIRHYIRVIANEEDWDHPLYDATGKLCGYMTRGEVIAEKLLKEAKKGKVSRLVELAIDNVDGKLLQKMQIEPLEINVTYNKDCKDSAKP
jgi:hypothetical protein